MMTRYLTGSWFLLSLAALGVARGEESTDRFQRVASRVVLAMASGDYAALRADYSTSMLDATSVETDRAFFGKTSENCGKLERLGPPRLVPPDKAVFAAHFERSVVDFTLVLDDHDKIVGMAFRPPPPAVLVPKRNLTPMGLPFQGEWYVLWGGETKELNRHHDLRNQCFAFDFVIMDGAGKTHTGDGTTNEDYYAFGQPVLAPADGRVTDVINGVRDNAPGSPNGSCACGNAVAIEQREHEVTLIGHMKQGSIQVKPGDLVKRGQLLGLCGNSGMSSEPHIHFHMQNTPVVQDGIGMNCLFDRVVVIRDGNTEMKVDYSPIKGDAIKPE